MAGGPILIPGLPNDLAISCLIRIPRIYHLSLRAVNSQWRNLLLNPSSPFHTQRRELAFTNPTLFLLPISYNAPPSRVECTEIDLLTHRKSKTVFTNESVRETIFLDGYACISYGALVIVLGGFGPERASNSVHIFDTLTKKWTVGANMLAGRAEFAWGLIGNRLYVAGGCCGAVAGTLEFIAAAEVYDFGTSEWREVSGMPVALLIDVFFVVSGKLFVRGWVPQRNAVEAYSYCPLTNVWEDQNWMLRVLSSARHHTLNKFAIVGDENDIYMVELSEAFSVWGSLTERLYLSISRLNNETLEWVKVCQVLDKAESDFCDCSDNDRLVRFHGRKDGVVVLCHHDTDSYSDIDSDSEYEEVGVSSVCAHVLKVFVPCPSQWSSALVYA